MKIEEHFGNSIKSLMENHSQEYWDNEGTLAELLLELHLWLDEFDLKKGEGYDYTGANCIKHREQRHHIEGISEAVEIFSQHYGNQFKQIIREEAERHIQNDMKQIPFKDDYKRSEFWRSLRGEPER